MSERGTASASPRPVESRESRTASRIVVAFGLTFLIGLIVVLTSANAVAAPSDGAGGIHIGIAR